VTNAPQSVSRVGEAVTPASVLRPELLTWRAYHVADSAGMVKLDAMENPYALPADLQRVLGDALAEAAINRYPDPSPAALKSLLRAKLELPGDAEILLGNGSDEIIQILCQAVARPGAVVLGVEPSFVMYRVSAAAAGLRYEGVQLRSDFSIDEAALNDAIDTHRPALLFLACPNNPTGNLFDPEVVRRVIARAPGLVVIDEAYHAFANATYLGEIARARNVVVMRTLSKLGLAGLRLGFLVGSAEWLGELDKLRLPYNVNALTQIAATVALEHLDVLVGQARAILAERSPLAASLARLPGVTVFPSDANFITFRVPSATETFAGLKARKVLIKNLHGAHPLLANCLRVTVGTPDENRAFLDALTAALRGVEVAAAGSSQGK
jgi:histidinol-phosphate aminotransferase